MAAPNPPWTREELILALDLYMRLGRTAPGAQHPEVLKLSDTLNRLAVDVPAAKKLDRFRNPNGVAMKLANFQSHDPSYPGRGLRRGNRLELDVWKHFASDEKHLRAVAGAITSEAAKHSKQEAVVESWEEEEFIEGRTLARLHLKRERRPKLVERKKRLVLQSTGALKCEACDFDFATVYGEAGRNFAECHHIVPLAKLPGKTAVRLSDLAILCANCHRMIHRIRPTVGVEAFRSLVREQAKVLRS